MYDIYATNLQLHTCTCYYADPLKRNKATALPNDHKGRVYNAQKVTNKGNSAKYLRHGAPPRNAHREDKTTNFGGSRHLVEETAGVAEISVKYHPPVLEILLARVKNRPLSKAATNGAPTPTTINNHGNTGHKVVLLALLLLLLLLTPSGANRQTALHEEWHSTNRQNKNRIRKRFEKMIHNTLR